MSTVVSSSSLQSTMNRLNTEEGIIEDFQTFDSTRTSTSVLSRDTNRSANIDSDDLLYVALPKDFKDGKSILGWALTYFPLVKKIILLHINQPSQLIPMMGRHFPIDEVAKPEAQAYHQLEREKVDKAMNAYIPVCKIKRVQAEKLIVDNSDVAKGLLEMIELHGIQKLVMGAAADKRYLKDTNNPKSRLARTLCKEAHQQCQIWFISKGNLICTREGSSESSDESLDASPRSDHSTKSSQVGSGPSKSKSFTWFGLIKPSKFRSSVSVSSQEDSMRSSPDIGPHGSRGDLTWEQTQSIHESDYSIYNQGDESTSDSGSITRKTSGIYVDHRLMVPSRNDVVDDPPVSSVINEQIENGYQSLGFHPGTLSEEVHEIPFAYEQDNMESDVLYEKLQQVLSEAATLKDEAHAESRRRIEAENDAVKAMQRVKVIDRQYLKMKQKAYEELQKEKQEVEKLKVHRDEILEELHYTHEQKLDFEMQAKEFEIKYDKEMQLRKKADELLQKEKQDVQNLEEQKGEISEELRKAQEQKLTLERQVAESNNAVCDLNENMTLMKRNIRSLVNERDNLLLEMDKVVKEVQDLRLTRDISGSSQRRPSFTEFSYAEIVKATNNFDKSNCIGVGGFGSVHKGFLRHTTVAIKQLDAKSLQGHDEFQQEIEVLCSVRHPNLVTLIGACSEVSALVYEYLPNGSLEDRLTCNGHTTPLPWQVRTRICADICSGLIFLHSNKPNSVVHGDLKPANILLDINFTCKIGDFGISRLLTRSSSSSTTTLYRQTDPKGTYHYMDPEFGTTGMLTHQSDIFSFGIIILRLLTGKEPHGIVRMVDEALNSNQLQKILDASAGDWPFIQAQQLANLGVRCCEMNRRNRPDLVKDVWRVLEPMKNASLNLSVLRSPEEDTFHTPSYFICPIFQEVMRDPHIAADGFTYEAEALRGWIESGHDTSPMTNLKLENDTLIPNHTLRSAIQEWLQQRQLFSNSLNRW